LYLYRYTDDDNDDYNDDDVIIAAFVISDSYEDNADVSISSADRAGHATLHLELSLVSCCTLIIVSLCTRADL